MVPLTVNWYEIQIVNLFEQARSSITETQYNNIKAQLRKLIKEAFKAGSLQPTNAKN